MSYSIPNIATHPSSETNTTTSTDQTTENTLNLGDRINTIISDYKASINKNHLQISNLTKNELFKLMERLCEEISPDTVQIFRNENFNNNNNENDDNSVGEPRQLYDWIMTYLVKQDERLTHIIRTQQEQQQNLSAVTQCLLNQNEQILQLMHTQQEQQKYFRQLSDQHAVQQEQLTQLTIRQQQQETNNRDLLRTLQTQSSNEQSLTNPNHDRTLTEKQEQRKGYLDTLINLVNTSILLWTMVMVVKKP